MTKRDKRIEAIRQNAKGHRPQEVERILLDAGFSARSGKGDHRVYELAAHSFTLDFGQNPVKPVYIRELVGLLDAIAVEASKKEGGKK